MPALPNNLHNSGFLFLPGLSERHKTEAASLVFSAPESFKAALLTFRRFHAGEGDTLIRPAASIDTVRLFSAALIKPGFSPGKASLSSAILINSKRPSAKADFNLFSEAHRLHGL